MTRSSLTTLCTSISFATGKLLLFLVSSLFLLQPVSAAEQDKIRWNEKYATEKYLFGQEAIPFLQDHVGLLPKGQVLDLAIGEGRNGIFLATQGFERRRSRYFRGRTQESSSLSRQTWSDDYYSCC